MLQMSTTSAHTFQPIDINELDSFNNRANHDMYATMIPKERAKQQQQRRPLPVSPAPSLPNRRPVPRGQFASNSLGRGVVDYAQKFRQPGSEQIRQAATVPEPPLRRNYLPPGGGHSPGNMGSPGSQQPFNYIAFSQALYGELSDEEDQSTPTFKTGTISYV